MKSKTPKELEIAFNFYNNISNDSNLDSEQKFLLIFSYFYSMGKYQEISPEMKTILDNVMKKINIK